MTIIKSRNLDVSEEKNGSKLCDEKNKSCGRDFQASCIQLLHTHSAVTSQNKFDVWCEALFPVAQSCIINTPVAK